MAKGHRSRKKFNNKPYNWLVIKRSGPLDVKKRVQKSSSGIIFLYYNVTNVLFKSRLVCHHSENHCNSMLAKTKLAGSLDLQLRSADHPAPLLGDMALEKDSGCLTAGLSEARDHQAGRADHQQHTTRFHVPTQSVLLAAQFHIQSTMTSDLTESRLRMQSCQY